MGRTSALLSDIIAYGIEGDEGEFESGSEDERRLIVQQCVVCDNEVKGVGRVL